MLILTTVRQLEEGVEESQANKSLFSLNLIVVLSCLLDAFCILSKGSMIPSVVCVWFLSCIGIGLCS